MIITIDNLEHKKLIISEFEYIVQKMKSPSTAVRLFYFSAASGILYRIFNIKYDAHLLFLHNMLQYTHASMDSLLRRKQRGEDTTIELKDEVIDKLTQTLEKLIAKISDNKEIDEEIITFSELAYVTSGNGFYLFMKGDLKY